MHAADLGQVKIKPEEEDSRKRGVMSRMPEAARFLRNTQLEGSDASLPLDKTLGAGGYEYEHQAAVLSAIQSYT